MPAKSQEKVQTRPPVDEGDVLTVSSNLVNFDVTVRDKKGKVVTDLKADDFTVVENGVRQKIEFFDATLAGTNKSGAPAATTDNPSPSRLPPTGLPRNVVSLVLDAQTTESINLKAVRDGIINYVRDRVTTDDSVALFAIAGGLQLLQPFTQDKEKLISAVERAGSLSSGPKSSELRDINSSIADLRDRLSAAPSDPVTIAAGGSAAAQIMISRRVLEQYVQLRSALSVQQTRPVLAALAAICEGLRPVPGKKTLVMFSQGFVAPEALDWQVQSTIDIANRANVSIYIIDSTGLKGGTPQSGALVPTSALSGISAATSQESRIRAGAGESVFDTARYEGLNRQQDLLYQISGDTGGQFIKNTNDISEGLNRIDNEIRSRYTLAYRSTDPNFDGRFRKVKIEVQRSGVNVVARPGYYAIPPTQVVPFSPEDRELLANFNKFEEHSTLPLSVELNAFRAMQGLYVVPLSFEIPPEAVTFDKKAGKQQLQLDVIGVVKTQGSDKILSRLGGNFNVSLSPQQYESILNDKIYYRQDIELGEGSYTIDLVVKDRLSGKVAAKREKLVLPVADSELSVTNAILSRHATVFTPSLVGPPDVLSAGNVQIRPSPSREFRSSDNLIIFFKVYNAATVPQTGKPLVKVTVTLLRDGKAATKPFDYELTDAVKEGIPHLTFAKYIKLQGLAAGKYTALIETTDMVRQKTMRQESLFAITP
ncbi:MAG TPA: VWA domain-containing protein [Pyrinomonadaceae bacterium]